MFQTNTGPIVINAIDAIIERELRERGLYELLTKPSADPRLNTNIYTDVDLAHNRAVWYMYMYGQPVESENGFLKYEVLDPINNRAVVELVEGAILSSGENLRLAYMHGGN